MLYKTAGGLLLQFLSKNSLPSPPKRSFCLSFERVEVARLTVLSRLARALAFLSKSVSYLYFQDSAGGNTFSVAACRFSAILLVAHVKLLHLRVGSWWNSKTVSVRSWYLVVLCLIFNFLLNTSLGQKQEQQMTSLRGDCQENNEIQ